MKTTEKGKKERAEKVKRIQEILKENCRGKMSRRMFAEWKTLMSLLNTKTKKRSKAI